VPNILLAFPEGKAADDAESSPLHLPSSVHMSLRRWIMSLIELASLYTSAGGGIQLEVLKGEEGEITRRNFTTNQFNDSLQTDLTSV
jgi:hypothetical protein